MSFLWYMLIGIVAGKIMRGGGFGLVADRASDLKDKLDIVK